MIPSPPPRIEPDESPAALVPDNDAAEADEAPALDPFARAYRNGLLVWGDTPHRIVMFTFDDGPNRYTTPKLLDALDQAGIKAIFFLTGSRMDESIPAEREQAEVARDIVRRGHVVGNHTLDHANLPSLSDEEVLRQIDTTTEIFQKELGSRSFLFRPPYGALTPRVLGLIASRQYTPVLWNLGTGDWMVRDAQEVFTMWSNVFARRERERGDRGGIILLHDTHEWSIEAFKLIHAELLRRNCELIAKNEELYDFSGDFAPYFLARGAASPDTVAPDVQLDPVYLAKRQEALRSATAERCLNYGGRVPDPELAATPTRNPTAAPTSLEAAR